MKPMMKKMKNINIVRVDVDATPGAKSYGALMVSAALITLGLARKLGVRVICKHNGKYYKLNPDRYVRAAINETTDEH